MEMEIPSGYLNTKNNFLHWKNKGEQNRKKKMLLNSNSHRHLTIKYHGKEKKLHAHTDTQFTKGRENKCRHSVPISVSANYRN